MSRPHLIPPVSARLLTNDFGKMLLLSVSIGAFCGLGGLYANFYVDVSSGPSVVLFSAAVFFIVLTYTSLRSVLHLSPRKRKAGPRESNTPRKRGAL